MKTYLTIAAVLSSFALVQTSSWAQPAEPGGQPQLSPLNTRVPQQPQPPPGNDTEELGDEGDDVDSEDPEDPYATLSERAREMSNWGTDDSQNTSTAQPYAPRNPPPPFPKMHAPQLLAVPTGHLLPAAVVHSTTSLDTGGSFGGSLKVGLGDVGEFGVETSPRIRLQTSADASPDTIQPLVLASFRMGVAENRLFEHQPALALGFRKSFSREQLGNDIRVAGIDLVASKTFGKTSLHVGGVFWDASMTDIASEAQVLLHDTGTKRQIRPFGGIEAEPIKNAQLLVDLYWVPLFSPFENNANDAIKLTPTLSWGIRYHLSQKISFESGVRVPDIGEANLLDAQIFGQLSIATDKVRNALGVAK